MISISKAEHLHSFQNRGPGELRNGLFILFNFANYSTSIAMELKVSKENTGK